MTEAQSALSFADSRESDRDYHQDLYLELEGVIAEASAMLSFLSPDWKRSRTAVKVHSLTEARAAMPLSESEGCLSCHARQRGEFSMPFRHPVGKGFMECSSCHEPHGGTSVRQMRVRGTEATCVKCHEDKSGPFVFQRPAGERGQCQACHRPHGTTNPKMLSRPQVRFLCLECHTNTPSSHNLAQPRFQNCTVCHSRVHGSHLNRLLLE